MFFDYVNNVVDKRPKPCLYDVFKELIKSASVKKLITAYRSGDESAKKALPAFTFHASFGGKGRASKNALASGLIMADFDHLPDDVLTSMRTTLKEGGNKALNIHLAHVTPSGKGLRLVIEATNFPPYNECRTIADFQECLAQQLGLSEWLDRVTIDLARLSFCPQEEDVIYFSPRMWTNTALPEMIDLIQNGASVPSTRRSSTAPSDINEDVHACLNEVQREYEGFPLTEIFAHYFDMRGGLPKEGNRNAALYDAARELRYICDFNPATVAAAMPKVGLPLGEVVAVCRSACQSSRGSKIPASVLMCLQSLKGKMDEESEMLAEDDEETDASEANQKEALPEIVQMLLQCFPQEFRDTGVLAMLPCLGTLCTEVRARYLDGELHSPSFMTTVTAEQASGKSFTRKIVKYLLGDLKQEDEVERIRENAYRVLLKQSKNKKDQPEDPRVVIRCVPANISVAKLLQRLDYADGKHLFSFCEEMDTVIKSNAGGAWSQKNDIYRNAFDNSEYGQDYLAETSYSANLKVFYNLLVLGTPRQTRRFFTDVENGLVSRCCFATLPDAFGERMPVYKQLRPDQEVTLKERISKLRAARGEYNLSQVNEALDAWLEEQRQFALETADRARDIFRKRSAVIGFRAALCMAPLYNLKGKKSQEMLKRFALYVADLTLKGQLDFAGEQLSSILKDSKPKAKNVPRAESVFAQLPETFNYQDLQKALIHHASNTPPRTIIYAWRRAGLIDKNNNGKSFTKLKKS